MELKKTVDGFSIIEFADYNDVKCSLQKDSLATEEAIWLGCSDLSLKQMTPNDGWQEMKLPEKYSATTSMRLTREQVKELLPHLIKFVETGEF